MHKSKTSLKLVLSIIDIVKANLTYKPIQIIECLNSKINKIS